MPDNCCFYERVSPGRSKTYVTFHITEESCTWSLTASNVCDYWHFQSLMHSSDTDAHNHVNSTEKNHVRDLSNITSYNTFPVLFSNLLPSSRVVAQISSLLAILLYENQQYIKRIIVSMSKKSLRPAFDYSWGGGVKGMFLPLISRSVDPVCFNISPLYQNISSHQYHQLSYYIPHFKRELCKHHVRDPKSTRLRKSISWAPLRANRLAASQQQTTDIVLSWNAKK